jgi:hypothetical protein
MRVTRTKNTKTTCPRVDQRELEDVVLAVDSAIDGIAHHPRFKPGHEQIPVRRMGADRAPYKPDVSKRRQVKGEDQSDDDQEPGLERHVRKSQKQQCGQRHVHHKLLEVAHGFRAEKLPPAEQRAQPEEE